MLRHKTLILSLDRKFWPKLEHQARKKKKKKVTIQSKNCIYISNIYVFKPMLIGYYTQGQFF
jgi:hypothetical protein